MLYIEAQSIALMTGIKNNRGEYIVFLSAELASLSDTEKMHASDELHIELFKLQGLGLIDDVIQVTGRYSGQDEVAFMVKGNNNAGLGRVVDLAKRYRQESILLVEKAPWTGYKQGTLIFTDGSEKRIPIGVATLVTLAAANHEHKEAHTLFTTRKEDASCALAFVEVDEVDHGTGYRDIEHIIL